MHILLVDDDAELCSLLGEFLRREGFTVSCEHEGTRGLEHAAAARRRPGRARRHAAGSRRFRDPAPPAAAEQSPGHHADGARRGCRPDRRARTGRGRLPAQAVQPARTGRAHPRDPAALRAASAGPGGRIEVNGVALDPGTREVFAAGKRIELTTFEFDILEMLMRSAGRVLSRDALMENFYNRKATPFDRSIDMHISHLRKKLEHGETIIKTIRGVGYQFCRTPEDARAE